jgi:hypothetical protein
MKRRDFEQAIAVADGLAVLPRPPAGHVAKR